MNKGLVEELIGQAFAISRKNGTHRMLSVGDWVCDDERITTTPGSKVEIKFESEFGTNWCVYI